MKPGEDGRDSRAPGRFVLPDRMAVSESDVPPHAPRASPRPPARDFGLEWSPMAFAATTDFRPHPGDALIIVDVQKDFLPGGSLPVAAGDEVIPPLNEYARRFRAAGLPVVATRDWHPPDHRSFAAQGGPWPSHCVAGTDGARFAAALHLPTDTVVVSKAATPENDTYSGFDGNDLAADLRRQGVRRVFVGGLATDYCVLHTVRGALREGFATVLLTDAVRAVDVHPGDGDAAIAEMLALGAVRTELGLVSA